MVQCSAGKREGVDDVLAAVKSHREHLSDTLPDHRRQKRIQQVRQVVGEGLDEALWKTGGYGEQVEAMLCSGITPYAAASKVTQNLLKSAEENQSNELQA